MIQPDGVFRLPIAFETARLVLRPLTSSDASAMLDAVQTSRPELERWMRTSDTGNGYAREAVLALTQVAFHTLGARRVVIACDPENVRSARVAEACGYVLEARLRNEVVSPSGEVRDLLVHGLVDATRPCSACSDQRDRTARCRATR